MVVYNLGQQDILVRDTSVRINDGKYHVVRFIRTGVNSSLQVDDNQVTRSIGRYSGQVKLVKETRTLIVSQNIVMLDFLVPITYLISFNTALQIPFSQSGTKILEFLYLLEVYTILESMLCFF